MPNIYASLILILLSTNILFAQIGVGTTTPNTNSMLDLTSRNRGILIPRMAIPPAEFTAAEHGMLIFNTGNNRFEFWNNIAAAWQPLAGAASAWIRSNNFLYPTTLTDNIGIGTPTPTEKLHIVGNLRFDNALMPNNLAGVSGQVLSSQGAGVAPTWTTPAAASND